MGCIPCVVQCILAAYFIPNNLCPLLPGPILSFSHSLFLLVTTSLFLYLWGFPDSSVGKEPTCDAGHPGSIPGSGRSLGEGLEVRFFFATFTILLSGPILAHSEALYARVNFVVLTSALGLGFSGWHPTSTVWCAEGAAGGEGPVPAGALPGERGASSPRCVPTCIHSGMCARSVPLGWWEVGAGPTVFLQRMSRAEGSWVTLVSCLHRLKNHIITPLCFSEFAGKTRVFEPLASA